MAQNDSVGTNRLLYSIIGVLGGAVAVGSFFLFGGATPPSPPSKPADAPAVAAQPATPPAAPPRSVAPSSPPLAEANADLNALALSIDRAIAANDFAYADTVLADANRRYAGNGTWPPLQQRLARARADYDTRMRQAEARRLIAEARGFANVGDFTDAEAMLQAADRQMPGFAEIGQARGDIASMRTGRAQLYRERYQYIAAIDQAFTVNRLWEAERLLADYSQRFTQDDDYRARSSRLAESRAAATWQARLNQSRSFIATARQAMERGDFVEAERQLALADDAAPGFPEINQTRVDLSRRRVAAEQQQDGIRLILAAIDAAFQRKQYDDAERAIEDGRRRYGAYAGWTDLQRRNASARRGDDQQVNDFRARNARALDLVAAARRHTAQGDFAAADRSLNEANSAFPDAPEATIARAELERAKADRARLDAEARAVAASVDAALARQQYADAEKMIGDGTRRYPSYAGWNELSRRLTESRREKASPASNAPMPAQAAPSQIFPAAPPPSGASLPTASLPPPAATAAAAPPAATAAAAPPAATAAAAPATNSQLTALVTTARDAIKRSDFSAAEKAVAEAERLDAKSASTIEVRAELKGAIDKANAPSAPAPSPAPAAAAPAPAANTAAAPLSPQVPQLVAKARDAIKRSDLATADTVIAEAEKVDAKASSVVEARAELKAALISRHVGAARDAIKRSDLATAGTVIAEAEKVDAKASSVVEVRAELKAALISRHVLAARDAIKRSEFARAEENLAEAEKLDPKATAVVDLREELKSAQRKSPEKTAPPNKK